MTRPVLALEAARMAAPRERGPRLPPEALRSRRQLPSRQPAPRRGVTSGAQGGEGRATRCGGPLPPLPGRGGHALQFQPGLEIQKGLGDPWTPSSTSGSLLAPPPPLFPLMPGGSADRVVGVPCSSPGLPAPPPAHWGGREGEAAPTPPPAPQLARWTPTFLGDRSRKSPHPPFPPSGGT